MVFRLAMLTLTNDVGVHVFSSFVSKKRNTHKQKIAIETNCNLIDLTPHIYTNRNLPKFISQSKQILIIC